MSEIDLENQEPRAVTFEETELEEKIVVKNFGDEEIEVVFTRNPPLIMEGFGTPPPLRTGEQEIVDGILIERDVPVKVRDGATLYVDIYRPDGQTGIPAIMAFAFTKAMAGALEQGVPPQTASPYHKMEAVDPMYWCHYGYAVINVESRGCGWSDGDAHWWGRQVGEDGYDLIEWVAAQHWCNGKVGSFGNSGVAMETLHTAAQCPPSLACIAPWEGTSDLYRGFFCHGGVPEVGMASVLCRMSSGYKGQYGENFLETYKKYPLMNGYWEDKIVDLEAIEIPAYFCAGWSHFHLRGSLENFRWASSPKKWLRCHRDFEWPDDYRYLADLHKFFDRYLKNIRNGWEMTPRVRIDVMDCYEDLYQSDREEKEWPLARTQYTRMYLDAAGKTLSTTPFEEESSLTYDSKNGSALFTYQFTEETELTGYMKLRLWVAAESAEDMDVFVLVQKGDENGEFIQTTIIGEPHPGATGMQRVSLRELDPERTTDFQPVQTLRQHQYLTPGEIVPIDIEVLPTCRVWHAGETLRLLVSGNYERKEGWFEPITFDTVNEGNHSIYTGGKYDSHLLIPVIPAKINTGGYVKR